VAILFTLVVKFVLVAILEKFGGRWWQSLVCITESGTGADQVWRNDPPRRPATDGSDGRRA
jgi:hypothetical protein